jgi:hypothetical protein
VALVLPRVREAREPEAEAAPAVPASR